MERRILEFNPELLYEGTDVVIKWAQAVYRDQSKNTTIESIKHKRNKHANECQHPFLISKNNQHDLNGKRILRLFFFLKKQNMDFTGQLNVIVALTAGFY